MCFLLDGSRALMFTPTLHEDEQPLPPTLGILQASNFVLRQPTSTFPRLTGPGYEEPHTASS